MKTNLIVTSLLAVTLVLAAAPSQADQAAAQKGRAIAEEMDRRDLGWKNSRTKLKMVLKNRHGQSSSRELRVRSMEVQEKGRGDMSLTIFDRPRDIKGTAFLSHTKITDPDDQWLYLPAIKRVKRISSVNKSGSFVGSEFSYEDLVSIEVDRYSYTYLRDEACGTLTCFVVEMKPVYKHSGYTKLITWIDQDEYRINKIDFYDRKESKLKTMTYTGYKKYLDQYWRAHRLEMINHQTGKSTVLEFADYEFQVNVSKSHFSAGRLKRVR